MKYEIIRANERGHFDHGWLNTYHTFSFADYINRQRMNFGALRVINDDYIAPGGEFPFHPHENMEIISIILEGTIAHEDNLGNNTQIKTGEIQVMSAGSGIIHSEKNPSSDQELNLLQIWIYPKLRNITPHYAQKSFIDTSNNGNWIELVAPEANPATLMINQDAYIAIFTTDTSNSFSYHPKLALNNGIFLMLINGEININSESLYSRDAIAIIGDNTPINFTASANTKLIALEVPLVFAK